jgi:hypothetical protein
MWLLWTFSIGSKFETSPVHTSRRHDRDFTVEIDERFENRFIATEPLPSRR